RILVIDDQASVLATIKAILEFLGHEAVTATGADDGIKILEVEAFDLLIVDIFMPEMDGIEAIHTVRHHQPSLPIIAMSGSSVVSHGVSTLDFLSMATKLGAVHGLRKPFTRAQLTDVVNACLDESGQRRDVPKRPADRR
ncbi:MAG TPA: response regulator, partial [Pseudorhodoplanes sp.]|nr:response regulator [Pseudorhodoplanes sp.]